MKAQSQIIQLVIFFMIGLAIFIMISNYFRANLDHASSDISTAGVETVGSYVSAASVLLYTNCKGCDQANITIRASNTTADFITRVAFDDSGSLRVSAEPGGVVYLTNMYSLVGPSGIIANVGGAALTVRPIQLSLLENKNRIRISSP